MTPDAEHWEKLAGVLARDNSALADELVRHGWTQDCNRCAALIDPDDTGAAGLPPPPDALDAAKAILANCAFDTHSDDLALRMGTLAALIAIAERLGAQLTDRPAPRRHDPDRSNDPGT